MTRRNGNTKNISDKKSENGEKKVNIIFIVSRIL